MPIKAILRGRIYHAVGTYRGVTVRETLGTSSKREAEDLVGVMQRDILDGVLKPGRKRKTFAEGAEVYWEKGGRYAPSTIGETDPVTAKSTRLVGAFGDMDMHEITEDDVLDHIRKHFKGRKASYINRHVIGPIKAVLKANRIDTYLNIDKLREEKTESPYATPEYFQRALEVYAERPHLAAAVLTMTVTGRRRGDVAGWMRDKVDWEKGEVHIGKTKNGEPMTVHLPGFLLEILRALPEFENGRLFGYSHPNSLNTGMARLCRKHKIEMMSPHRIGRHTFATWAMKFTDLSLKEIQDGGGWESMDSVKHYLHMRPRDAQVRASSLFENILGLHKINTSMVDAAKNTKYIRRIRR